MDPEDHPSLPPNIETLRMQLFHMNEPLTLPLSVFNEAWKYLDNIYVPNANRKARSGYTTYYWCRLWRQHIRATVPPEKRKRNKRARPTVGCPCRVKGQVNDAAQTITFTRKTKPHNHDYSLMENKLTSGAKEMIARGAAKGYRAHYLTKTLKDPTTGNWQTIQAAGGGGLSAKDVVNIIQMHNREHPDGKADIDVQVKDMITVLLKKFWLVSELTSEQAHGVVFAHMDGIQGLQRRGHLMLIQTANNMNQLKWRLTTFMIRDEYGSWIPAVFFVRDCEDFELIAMAFDQIKTWCGDKWPLRYIISDGTMGGQEGANWIFGDEAEKDRREVTHFFCTVHSERVIRQYFGRHETRIAKHLRAAMYSCVTEAGCHSSIDAAISACSHRPHKAYITQDWKSSTKEWAMYARQKSVFLMQARSTMPVEDWHKRIRQAGAFDTARWSLSSIGKRIVNTVQEYMSEAKQTYRAFRSKTVPQFEDIPMLYRFPYPIQSLIFTELLALEEDPAVQEAPDPEKPCPCPFFRKWQVPCRHILKQEKVFGRVFTKPHWERKYSKWENCGFETYEAIAPDPIPDADQHDRRVGERTSTETDTSSDAEIFRIINGIRNRNADFRAILADEDPASRETASRSWLYQLQLITAALREGPLPVPGLAESSQPLNETDPYSPSTLTTNYRAIDAR